MHQHHCPKLFYYNEARSIFKYLIKAQVISTNNSGYHKSILFVVNSRRLMSP